MNPLADSGGGILRMMSWLAATIRRPRQRLLWMLAATSVTCGGKVDDRNQTDAAPSEDGSACDGDLTGTWQLSSVSFVQTPPPSPVGTCGRRVLTPQPYGSVTFMPDGTFTSSAMIINDETITICGLQQGCADLQGSLVGRGISAACVEAGPSACTCSEAFAPIKRYSYSGRLADISHYCAKGGKLRMPFSTSDGTGEETFTRK
jgi:hypothetical protein